LHKFVRSIAAAFHPVAVKQCAMKRRGDMVFSSFNHFHATTIVYRRCLFIALVALPGPQSQCLPLVICIFKIRDPDCRSPFVVVVVAAAAAGALSPVFFVVASLCTSSH